MLKFFRALFFLLGTAAMANTRHVQDERPASSEEQFPSVNAVRVEISHTMNPTHRGSNCVLYYQLPSRVSSTMLIFNQVSKWISRVSQHVEIAFRDDVIDFCFGRNAQIFLYSMSDQPGQISRSLPSSEGQTELKRRLAGSWCRMPTVSGLSQPLK